MTKMKETAGTKVYSADALTNGRACKREKKSDKFKV